MLELGLHIQLANTGEIDEGEILTVLDDEILTETEKLDIMSIACLNDLDNGRLPCGQILIPALVKPAVGPMFSIY